MDVVILITYFASLATETEYVRSKLAQYGNDLLSLGVDGFRLDAAKRTSSDKRPLWSCKYFLDIAAGDISNILGRLTRRPYVSQEVIWAGGEPIQPSEYVGNGACTSLVWHP